VPGAGADVLVGAVVVAPVLDGVVVPAVDRVVDGAGELDAAVVPAELVLGAVEEDAVGGAVVVSVTVTGFDDDGATSESLPAPLRVPPSTENPLSPPEIGAPFTASTTVTAPRAPAKTAAEAARPISIRRSRPGRDHQRLGPEVGPPLTPAVGAVVDVRGAVIRAVGDPVLGAVPGPAGSAVPDRGGAAAAPRSTTVRVTAVSSTVSAASIGEPGPTRTCCTVCVTLRRVSISEWPITALPTTETTDAIAAPTMVPATPSCAPMKAATTAADMLAMTCVAVSANLGSSASPSAP
jgi:hypothetical protein